MCINYYVSCPKVLNPLKSQNYKLCLPDQFVIANPKTLVIPLNLFPGQQEGTETLQLKILNGNHPHLPRKLNDFMREVIIPH